MPRISVPRFDSSPELTMWRTDIDPADRLKIINPGDFPKKEVLSGLGIDGELSHSFGISDPVEIKARLAVSDFLLRHPAIRELISQIQLLKPPTDEEKFLDFYDPTFGPHNPAWKEIHELINALDAEAETLPSRLKELLQLLKRSLVLEEPERQMASQVIKLLTKVAIIEGSFTFYFKRCSDGLEEVDPQNANDPTLFRGHLAYSLALSKVRFLKHPTWTENGSGWVLGKITRHIIDWLNDLRRERAMRAMIITETNAAAKNLIHEVKLGTLRKLEKLPWDELHQQGAFDNFGTYSVQVYFAYDQDGMKIRIFDVEPTSVTATAITFQSDDFDGYRREERDRFRVIGGNINTRLEQLEKTTKGCLIQAQIRKMGLTIFDDFVPIASPISDSQYRWYALQNLFSLDDLNGIYEAVLQNRTCLQQHLIRLQALVQILNTLEAKAKKLGSGLEIPTILDHGSHAVEFEEIMPVHLLARGDSKIKLRPIRELPQLNGRMIAISGKHGGGKTVTELSIAANIFLAQSGLPILGTNFSLNVKKVLGLVFIERGQGSTCELLVQKIANIMKGIKGHSANEVVLILDELGTGTQENAGLALGIDLLIKLRQIGVSVIFSTQITSMIQMAQSNLNAICLQVTSDHRIIQGIGDGGLLELRKRKGLDKLLATAGSN